MANKFKTVKDFVIEYYYDFMDKLYGNAITRDNTEFEERVNKRFGKNPDQDIDVEVWLEIKTASKKTIKRKARSLYQFKEFHTKPLPEDTVKITFNGVFVERNDEHQVMLNSKKKEGFAFKEQIIVVDVLNDTNIRKVTKQSIAKINPNIKVFEKDELAEFSKIINFEKNELTL